MITEQQLLNFMQETAYKPMTYQELEQHFQIQNAADFKEFLKLLIQLEDSGKIIRTRAERYGVPERMNLVRGRLQAHAKGFAFLIPEETGHPDVYVHANDLKTAMHGDIVLVRIANKGIDGMRMEGEVVRIVKRAIEQVVGVFQNYETYGFVVPDDKRINRDVFIPQEAFNGAVSGQKVVVRIVNYPEGRTAAQGEVAEILGHKDDPGVDILSIIRKHKLPEAFPDGVMAEAEAVPDSITEEEIISQRRRDLRGMNIVTIDGEDAKDLDDAVYVERLPNGNYKLGVHIADVGYYVREGSELDSEAYARGCSVYLVDRVIPMLPHRLSNGICSLHPHVDRLTLSCEMEFDEKAKLVRHDVFSSVIRSVERMTYTNVRKIVEDEDPEVSARYEYLVDSFKLMKELAMKLRGKRIRRGAIDFDFQESKVIVAEDGTPVDIIKRDRSVAEQIIEEFMLAANETVAEHFHWLRVPFLYRIHEEPDSERLFNFMSFAANFGYVVRGKGNSVHPRALQSLLEEIQGTREQTVISTMMLRSMRQAKYDAESTGHFGLAAEFYSHFTSPIRRYPDLVIHRVIREVTESGGALNDKRLEQLQARMPDIAQQSSERERVAVDAERDTVALKKAEFMLDKVGEEFDAIISSVTSFGMFVELDNTVEGLIRLSELSDDYYHFHEQHMVLIGERTSNIFRIGDEVRIRVARVNMEEHTVDFELLESKSRYGSREAAEFGFELRKRRGRGDDRGGSGARGAGGRGSRDGGRDGRGGQGAARSGGRDARGGQGAGRSGGRDARGGGQGAGRSDGRDARGGGQGAGRSGGRDARGGGQGAGRNEGRDARGGGQGAGRSEGRDARGGGQGAGRNEGRDARGRVDQGGRFGDRNSRGGRADERGRHGDQTGREAGFGDTERDNVHVGLGGSHLHEEPINQTPAVEQDGEWLNAAEYRRQQGRSGRQGQAGRQTRGRDRNSASVDPYKRQGSSGTRERGQGGIRFGQENKADNNRNQSGENNGWVDRLISDAEKDADKARNFDFGSGRGGYGRSGSHDGPFSGGGRNGGYSSRSGTSGGKKGRRSTSNSGIFIGDQAAQARDHAKQEADGGNKKAKSNRGTAKFIRKKR
ncbi:ribonuclease R [Paenibacillus sp. 481]|uniref:ribonuclease R n=1 Tax=Paenibacillus sp. 481 TaxID=2835869 RepID=UPI001E2C76DD|nr:ribonuclease R [Paenibacillus sp. 481]UHA75167.1 ribonuclease R [Paenibacillus sp. 481]